MNSRWTAEPLRDLCEFRNGLWKGKKPPYIQVGVIRNTNFNPDGSLDDADIAILDVEQKQFEKRQLKYGDIIVEKSGGGPKQPVGRVVLFEKSEGLFSFSNFTSIIRVRDKKQLDCRYLHRLLYWYYLSGATESMQKRSTGIRNLDFNAYRELPVPLPSITWQRRIVKILDEAFKRIDETIKNTERNVLNARAVFESKLNHAFTETDDDWIETRLDRICSIKHGFAFKSKFFSKEGEYVVLTPGSLFETGGFRDQGEKTKYYFGDIPEGYILAEGDFLIAMTEQAVGLLGSSLIVPESNRYLHNQRLGLVQVNTDIEWHNEFFLHQFNTKRFREAVERTASGVKVRHTSPTKLGEISVKFPPNLSAQRALANHLNRLLEQTNLLQDTYRAKLLALRELRKSLLRKALLGQLTAERTPNTSREAVA